MVELDQFKYTLSTYEKPLQEVRESMNLDAKIRRIDELDKTMEEPSFWEDAETATKMVKESKRLKDTVSEFNKIVNQFEEIGLMIEMGYEENDPEVIPEIEQMLDEFAEALEALRLSTLLTGEYDSNNAILKLSAGAGGTEACDWCSMLYRMYCRWCEQHGFSTEVLDYLDGEEAGIKWVTIKVTGENAFGYLKSERGVHRLVRISPFNAAGKRQTSFVSSDVMPDIEEDLDVEINMEDKADLMPALYVNGQQMDMGVIDAYPMSEVISVSYLDKFEAMAAGMSSETGVIILHVRDINAREKFLINSMAEVVVPGYATPVEFYAPDYSVKNDKEKKDNRTTIAWIPSLQSNSLGDASFAFWSADRPSDYRIVIEGITADGELLHEEVVIQSK